MSSIGDRLEAARTRLFVGREVEVERFRTAVQADSLPFHILHVFGPGGVGKTALLQAFGRECDAADVPATHVDLSDVDPSPPAVRQALRRALGLDDDTDVLAALDATGERHVLLLDHYNTIAALDDWLRTTLLPDLPAHVMVVMAGRDTPAAPWRTDPGWRAITETMPLRNLDADAGRALLRRRDVPEREHDAILTFTHGHPLATALVADLMDQRGSDTFEPRDAPDVVQPLLEQFVQRVPGPAHRTVLETAALVPYTTEALLESVLDMPDVHDLFEWLRGLSFTVPGERGLALHDLARTALAADLRWRNPEWHAELHERARQFYTNRLKEAASPHVPDLLSDITFLLRRHPLIQPFYDRLRSEWDEAEGLIEDTPREDDWPRLTDMVAAQEGPAGAEWARHWFERQPEGVRVYRAASGAPMGFMLTLNLTEATPEARAADPVTDAAWNHLEAHAPLRPGERASLFRFWMARDTYQQVSPVQSLIFIRQVRHYLQTPDLAYTVLACGSPKQWDALFSYAGMERWPEADVTVDGHTTALYGHDWRAQPPAQWLDQLADRGLAPATDAAPDANDRIIVLNRSDFEDALRDAVKNLHRPDHLHDNPLLYSRLVTNEAGSDAAPTARREALQHRIEAAVEQLAADPRDEKYHRAVARTYLQPALTQEKAAEQIGVPFSTYRRHLNRGLDRVTDLLWEAEVDPGPSDDKMLG